MALIGEVGTGENDLTDRLANAIEHAEPRHEGEVLGSEVTDFTEEQITRGERVTAYYASGLPEALLYPPDETRTHSFRRVIEQSRTARAETSGKEED